MHLCDRRTATGAHQGTVIEAVPPATGSHGGADPQMIDAFLKFARTGENPGAAPIDARNAVAAGCCATESLRNGNQPMNVPRCLDY